MASRKEDEKNERIIRNLLKLPDNRRCINCNSLGPQYVCTTFWTFVCTACSGIHREFTHRVKSVSMAKFTSQEVSALQAGGNARAKEIYFKEWDSQRHSFPDGSNVERLRDFIKHVYVDRRYSGERSFDKPPRVKTGEAEDSYDSRRDAYQGGSRSPPYEDTYERRYSDRPSPGGRSDDRNYRNNYDERRSPGYDQENRQYGDFRRSPARPEVVNDWRREDRFGNGRRVEDGRIPDGSSKAEGRSPDRQKDPDASSPPVVRPVRDILGDNVSPLRVIEPPKLEPPKVDGKVTDGTVRTQRTTSSSSLASSNGNPVETKKESLGSLIDFDAVPEPPTTAAMPQTQQTVAGQSFVQPTTTPSADNWACFDSPAAVKVTQAPPSANSLDSVLSGLSVPAPAPNQTVGMPGSGSIPTATPVVSMSAFPPPSSSSHVGQMLMPSFGSNAPLAAPTNNLTMFPPVSGPAAGPGGQMSFSPFGVGAPATATSNNLATFPGGGVRVLAPGMLPQQRSLFSPSGIQPNAQPFIQPVSGASSNQPWNSSLAPGTQGPVNVPPAQASQAVPRTEVTPEVEKQSTPSEVKPTGRKALPEDLFTVAYPPSMPHPGWQAGPPYGFGFNMQYNAGMRIQTFPQPVKSTNPFDVNNEASPVQAPTFPSMVSLQGALPNVAAPTGLVRTSSLGTPSPTWMPSQSTYLSTMPPQAPPFASAMPPSAYMGQQMPNNLAPRQQAGTGFGGDGAAFGFSNPNPPHPQMGGMYSAPAGPNTFSTVSGNPFG